MFSIGLVGSRSPLNYRDASASYALFFAYRFCVPENRFGNIIIMVGWLGPPSGGPLSVAVLRTQVSPPPDFRSVKQIESISLQIVNNSNAFRRKLLQDRLRRLCNRVNQPIPPPEWIALNHDQIDLLDSPNTN